MDYYPIIDLHSDLLSYLRMGKERTPHDPASRSSIPQLKAGHVKLQTLAIYTQTGKGSTVIAQEQIQALKRMVSSYPLDCALYSPNNSPPSSASVQFIPAFENGAGFSEESEPLTQSLERLETICRDLGRLLYIGMTWDGENRFGGGVGSKQGLKEDGKRLLEWMAAHQVPIDFSHTSDLLAEGILNHIDQEGLQLPVMASHSNFRSITNRERNMPDWLAHELVRRKGLLGLTFFGPFIHQTDPSAILRHVEYALSLGAHDSLAFGADFFCDTDFPSLSSKYETDTPFFDEFANASCYGKLLNLLQNKLHLSTGQLQKIGSANAERFLTSSSS